MTDNRTSELEQSRECEMEKLERWDGSDPHYRCKACGHENYEDYLPRFCPQCGKKVMHGNQL